MSRRAKKRDDGFRSGLEAKTHAILTTLNIAIAYEEETLEYIQPETTRKYLVDFTLPSFSDILIECKGRFTSADRKKMLLVKEQHPHRRIIMVFQRPMNTLSKASKTTYASWCEKHGIEWVDVNKLEQELPCLLRLTRKRDGTLSIPRKKKQKKSVAS